MKRIEIVYSSGYGHTAKQAEALAEGAGDVARLWKLSDEGTLSDEGWAALDAASGIIFGSPTYMGGPTWQFKKFAEATSKRWMERAWSGKLMGGFTNSASANGDKAVSMIYLATFAAQHGGLWVSLDQLPANMLASTPADCNWSGGALGPLAISPADSSPEQGPLPGDLLSARTYGAHFAALLETAPAPRHVEMA